MITDDGDNDDDHTDVVKTVIFNVLMMVRSAELGVGISKFDCVLNYNQDMLHWLPILQHIEFKISIRVWQS